MSDIDTSFPITRTPVEGSSTIKSIGHDKDHLDVEFHSGAVYRYANVPGSVHDALVSSPSIGKAHGLLIKQPQYKYVKLPQEPKP